MHEASRAGVLTATTPRPLLCALRPTSAVPRRQHRRLPARPAPRRLPARPALRRLPARPAPGACQPGQPRVPASPASPAAPYVGVTAEGGSQALAAGLPGGQVVVLGVPAVPQGDIASCCAVPCRARPLGCHICDAQGSMQQPPQRAPTPGCPIQAGTGPATEAAAPRFSSSSSAPAARRGLLAPSAGPDILY